MLLGDVKKAVYQAVSKTGVKVYDRLPMVDKYPYIILETSASGRRKYKNSMGRSISFTLDIFSNYKGEKEIYDLDAQIEENMDELLKLGQVMVIEKEQFAIINDTNPVVKHGIITYKIKLVEV